MIIYAREKEVLKAQKRSLSAWINNTLGATVVNAENLLEKLSTGVTLCRLAKCIQQKMDDVIKCYPKTESQSKLKYWDSAKRETFFARDNAEIFIRWCKSFGVRDAVLFESDGLVLRSQPRSVLLCLSEVSRLAARFGVLLPPPIQLSTSLEEGSDLSDDDEFFFARSPSLAFFPKAGLEKAYQRWDSGCSSGGARSPSWSCSSSPTAHLQSASPSPPASILRKSAPTPPLRSKSPTKKEGQEANEVVIVVRSSGSKLDVSSPSSRTDIELHSNVQDHRKVHMGGASPPPRPPSPQPRRGGPMVRSDTISSRLKGLNGSVSSLMLPDRKDDRDARNRFGCFRKMNRMSVLDRQVLDTARKLHKDESQIHRISEGHYNFGDKSVLLRIVRDKNVVVRLGGGWDTLEHYMSNLDFSRWDSLHRRTLRKSRRNYSQRNIMAPYMTL